MRGLYGGYYHPVSPCPSFSPRASVPADKSVFFMYLPVIESVIITTFPVFESVTIPSVITSALLLARTRFDCLCGEIFETRLCLDRTVDCCLFDLVASCAFRLASDD